jgi:hypothetical protein
MMNSLFQKTGKKTAETFSTTVSFMCFILKPIIWLACGIVLFTAFASGGYVAVIAAPFFLTLAIIDVIGRRMKRRKAERAVKRAEQKKAATENVAEVLIKKAAEQSKKKASIVPGKVTAKTVKMEEEPPKPAKPEVQKIGLIGRMKIRRKVKKAFYNEMTRYVELALEEKGRYQSMKVS